jgi:4-amino-4-deoxy-L-arabinose transferase-like glycosyltransferase
MLVVLAAKFQGLEAATALDHAQLARHVAAGEGFVTDFIRPLSLVFQADYRRHPDLYNAPAHPLVLALFYRARHPSDKMTAGAGAVLWILSVWLTFWVARRWLGPGIAALATLFYACNVPIIIAALSGLPQPLLAISVLLAVYLAFPEDEDVAGNLPGWRLGLVGLACALAALTHYLLLTVPLALGVYLLASQPQKKRVLAWFGIGFLLPLLPWMVRNFRVAGSPVFSLFWYEVLANTRTYPGESVWRTAAPPLSPVFFIAQHPGEIVRKILIGLTQFGETTLNLVHPVVGFLFLAALLVEKEDSRVRGLLAVVGGSLVLGVAGSCLLRPEPALLLAWEPLLIIAGTACLVHWISERVEGISFQGLTITLPGSRLSGEGKSRERRVSLGRLTVSSRWSQTLAYLLVMGLVGFPLFFFLVVSRPGPDPRMREQIETLRLLVPEGATVMTDQPALVAWYADRRAVWLCQREEDWLGLERTVGPVDATYLTPGIAQMAPAEQGDWWFWLTSPRGVYQGLAPAERRPPTGVLKVRRK